LFDVIGSVSQIDLRQNGTIFGKQKNVLNEPPYEPFLRTTSSAYRVPRSEIQEVKERGCQFKPRFMGYQWENGTISWENHDRRKS